MGCSGTLSFNVEHIYHYIQQINLRFILKLLTCNVLRDKSCDASNQEKNGKLCKTFAVVFYFSCHFQKEVESDKLVGYCFLTNSKILLGHKIFFLRCHYCFPQSTQQPLPYTVISFRDVLYYKCSEPKSKSYPTGIDLFESLFEKIIIGKFIPLLLDSRLRYRIKCCIEVFLYKHEDSKITLFEIDFAFKDLTLTCGIPLVLAVEFDLLIVSI